MSLPGGSRLGPYELLAPIGAGGMGEVYKARDTRLDRTVAVKVLPAQLARDAERRARLEREARAISSLGHPHICALYDVGNQDGLEFLVMEYLDGESLDKRLARGPLPIDQTLQVGGEIAAALEHAHRQGIVHRDLKPGNIMLTRAGAKLLDFGIAKAAQGRSPMLDKTAPAGTPTLRPLTGEGTLVGSLHYMAPEQLEGREADARSDLFALGLVLYEMATGRRAFDGVSQASVIAAILERQPAPISTLQPLTPPAFERLLRVCLAKDPDERWQSAHDVRAQLQGIAESSVLTHPATAPARRRRRRERWAWAALVAVLGVSWGVREGTRRPARVAGTVRAALLPPPGAASSGPLALSPDGTAVAFTGFGADGVARLFVRALAETEARMLAGTDDASLPFWSPDGRSLGFFAQRQLKRVELAGGPPHVLADISDARGGSWGADGRIVFAPNPGDGLYTIGAEGGATVPLTRLDPQRGESSHRWPTLLPDGRHVLYLALSGQRERTSLQVAPVGGAGAAAVLGERLLPADSAAVFAAPDLLFFVRGQNLLAQRLDAVRLRLDGEAMPLAEGVWRDPDLDGLRALSAASSAGGVTIAYRRPGLEQAQLVRFDREGKELHTLGAPGTGGALGLSPDGRRIARSLTEEGASTAGLWLLDAAAQSSPSRLTFNRWNDIYPVWSPDGRRIAFASDRTGSYNLFEKAVDGAGGEIALHASEAWEFPEDYARDGRSLLFTRRDPRTKSDVWVLSLPERTPRALLASDADELQPRLAPNGAFVAYASDESGRSEIYVQTVPPSGAKWQVSTGGGFQPQWRQDGAELYFVGLDLRLMAAAVETRGAFAFKPPQALFLTHTRRSALRGATEYVPSADGRQFVVDTTTGTDLSSPIQLVVGWVPPPR